MTEIQVLGITTRRSIEFERSFCIMGFGDIALPGPEVTLRGCALARSNGKIIALPPKIPGAKLGELSAMQWNTSGEFAKRVKEKLLEAYQKMGGEMPPEQKPKRVFVPYSELAIDPDSDVPIRDQIEVALDVESEKRGARCYTEIFEWPEPSAVTKVLGDEIERDPKALAYDAAVASHAASRDEVDDTEAAEGLHRVLGVDAVEETMVRAGL